VVNYAESKCLVIRTVLLSRTSKINTIVLREGNYRVWFLFPTCAEREDPDAGNQRDFVYQRKAAKDT